MVEKEAQRLLTQLSNAFPIANDADIFGKLSAECEDWQFDVTKKLKRDNPFLENKLALEQAEKSILLKNSDIALIEQDFENYQNLGKQTHSSTDDKFWLDEINQLKNYTKQQALVEKYNNKKQKNVPVEEKQLICRTLLTQKWRKLLDEQSAKWELEIIQNQRELLFKKLKEWLELVQQLANLLSELSLETGLLFDLSKDNISLSDIEQLKRWMSYISKDDGVKKLCDLLGKLRRAEKTQRQEIVKQISIINEYIPDVNSKSEIVGIHLGRDIEHILPQEIALLADDETSILFDMKFVEGRLMCFDMAGFQSQQNEIEEEVLIEIEEEEKLGPIIICVDTSGSMQGSPETIAKAITLFMANRAISQKRNCLLINFSTGIETLDLSGKKGFSQALKFLQRSFHGGTDVAPALNYAIEMMNKDDYKKSDLLIISDFIMDSLPEILYQKVSMAKKNKNRFYSLSIGNLFLSKRTKEIFDNEWVYNPNTSSIDGIHNIIEEIAK